VDYTFLRAAGERAIAHYHNRALAERNALPPPENHPALPAAASAGAAAALAPRIIEAESASAEPQPPAETPVARDGPAPSAAIPVAPARPTREKAPQRVREKRQRRPVGVYLWLFVIIVMAATIVACVALGTLLSSAIHLPL